MSIKNYAVIGAGVAGLACAQRLANAGQRVRVYDKGRSPGGRLATRRVDTPHGMLRFDHGAQFLTARDQTFSARLDDFVRSGVIARYANDVVALDPSGRLLAQAGRLADRRWAGVPGMSALGKALGAGLDIRTSTRIERILPTANGWLLATETGASAPEGPFDGVIVAVPAEQAIPLVRSIAPDLADEARDVSIAPCWAGLLAFERTLDLPFEAARIEGDGVLSWVARQRSATEEPTAPEAWVVHASPAWSRTNLELSPEEIAPLLLEGFSHLASGLPPPILLQAHRWRYALVEKPAATAFAWEPHAAIGLCGDWRLGARVEAAWLSGDGLAATVLELP